MSEWGTVRYGDVTFNVRTRAGSDDEQLLSVTAANGIIGQSQSGRRDTSASDKSKYLVVEPGDVVYNTMRMWQGVSGFSEMRGIVSPAYTVLRPSTQKLDGRFLAHLMKLPSNIRMYRAYSQGLVSDTWNLKFGHLSQLQLDIPPLNVQRRIADVLDTIDNNIQICERIISKLEVQIDAISQAIFGRSWWAESQELIPVGTLLKSTPRNGKSPQESETWSGAFMLGLGCLTERGFRPNQLKLAPKIDDSLYHSLLVDGELLMSRSNTLDKVGFVGTYRDVGQPCIYSDLMMRLVPNSQVSARFLELILQSEPVRTQIRALASGTSGSMMKITGGMVAKLSVAKFSPEEQASCCYMFNAVASQLDVEERQVSKLRNLRAGLAADLLTGRVRTGAA